MYIIIIIMRTSKKSVSISESDSDCKSSPLGRLLNKLSPE